MFDLAVDAEDKSVVCTINATMSNFTQMFVGAYEKETGRLLGVAVGTYNGTDNTLTVTFDCDLPETYDLRVFCTNEDLQPQYQVREFSQGAG